MKKLLIGMMALALCFSFSFAVTAEENDIRDEMAALEQMLADLAAQLGGTVEAGDENGNGNGEEATTISITGIPAGFTFAQNLRLGARGVDVKYLQILLNADADTRIATTGAGSPGVETETFGPLTDAAVKKFQSKYASEVLTPVGLTTATGFVGAQTRAKLNALLAGGVPGTPGAPESEVMTMLKELSDAIKALSARVDALDTAVGEEGTLEGTRRNDIREIDVYANTTEDVAKFRFEAKDSSVTIQRADLTFSSLTNFRNAVSKVMLYVDGEKVGEMEVNRTTLPTGTSYVRFSGLDIVVPKDGYKDVVVAVTGKDSGTANTITIGFNGTNPVRYLDGAGVTKYVDITDTRTFSYKGDSTGNLTAKRNTESPDKGVVTVEEDTDTEIDLLVFDLSAKDSDLDVEKLTVEIEAGVATGLSSYFATSVATTNAVKTFIEDRVIEILLYDGDELLATGTLGGTATNATDSITYTDNVLFEFDSALEIPKGESKKLKVVARVRLEKVEYQGFVLGANLKTGVNANVAYDASDALVNLTGTETTGRAQHVYIVVPMFSNVTYSFTREAIGTTSDAASGWIKFDVTAYGGTVHLNKDETVTTAVTTTYIANVTSGEFTLASLSLNTNASHDSGSATGDYSNYYYFEDGVAKYLEFVFGTVATAKGTERVETTYFNWKVEGADNKWYRYTWYGDFVEDLKTNTVTLHSN